MDDGNIEAIPVDSPDPIFLALSGSGTTASLAFEKVTLSTTTPLALEKVTVECNSVFSS